MEQNETIIEPIFRVAMKQNSKGQYFGEFTIRANTLEELKTKFAEAKELVTSELKKLNGV